MRLFAYFCVQTMPSEHRQRMPWNKRATRTWYEVNVKRLSYLYFLRNLFRFSFLFFSYCWPLFFSVFGFGGLSRPVVFICCCWTNNRIRFAYVSCLPPCPISVFYFYFFTVPCLCRCRSFSRALLATSYCCRYECSYKQSSRSLLVGACIRTGLFFSSPG